MPTQSDTPSRHRKDSWHDDVYFGLHFDLHARENDTALGAELTEDHLRACFELIRPDWVQCDCKGHPGWTSWPTDVGFTSPGVVKDALAIHARVCHEMGIPLGMHYSGIIDEQAVAAHPDWGALDEKGNLYKHGSVDPIGPYIDELMIPQMIELIGKYDVDGFWVDGDNWGAMPCYTDRVIQAFKQATGLGEVPRTSMDVHWDRWIEFNRELFMRYVNKWVSAVHEHKPSCACCSNWLYTVRQPEPLNAAVDYLSGDYTPMFGADRAALEARFLDAQQVSWDLMCWTFVPRRDFVRPRTKDQTISSPIPVIFKNATHLKQEVSEVIALGGAVMLYANPMRSGPPVPWQMEICAHVAEFCRIRKSLCFKTRSIPQAAILVLSSHVYAQGDPLYALGISKEPIEGGLHALLENHIATNLLGEHHADRFAEYPLLLVTEPAAVTEQLRECLAAYVHAGGNLIITGHEAVDHFPDLLGVKALGPNHDLTTDTPSPDQHACGVAQAQVGREHVCIAGPCRAVAITTGEAIKPLMRLNASGPISTSLPLATLNHIGQGRVLAVHAPIMRQYTMTHDPRLRCLIGELVNTLRLSWRVRLVGPHYCELIVRTDGSRLLINLINRGAGAMMHEHRPILDELPAIQNVRVHVSLSAPPANIHLEPGSRDLDWHYDANARGAIIDIPAVEIHEIVVVEPGEITVEQAA